MNKVKKLHFRLHLNYDEFRAYYQGSASNVRLMSEEGLSIVFPASHLASFLKHDGVHGRFEISSDQNNKFISLDCIS